MRVSSRAKLFMQRAVGKAGQHQDQAAAGLGLPLARTLAELHGGKLVIESVPAEGT